MKEIRQERLTGERALFQGKNLAIYDTVFADGESPLKESENIGLYETLFKWKYPLWYGKHIRLENCTFADTARAGVWYTDDIAMKNCVIDAPKTFRRCDGIVLEDVTLPNAQETLWSCKNVRLSRVRAKGDYFAMNAEDMELDDFTLTGNYGFDGAKNIVIRGAHADQRRVLEQRERDGVRFLSLGRISRVERQKSDVHQLHDREPAGPVLCRKSRHEELQARRYDARV